LNSSNVILNDLSISFMNKLIEIYDERDYENIRKILIGNRTSEKVYKYELNNGSSLYIDDDSNITVRIWIDNESKQILDVIYYVCEKDIFLCYNINCKIIDLWTYTTNNDMSLFFKEIIKSSGDVFYIRLKVNKKVWDKFILNCKRLGITLQDGFKSAIKEYIKNKTELIKM